MSMSQAKTRRVIAAIAVPISVLAAAAVIWQSSYAAFESETRNSGNEWSSGQVVLTDDDNGSARFNVANMVPDQTDTRCIKVTSTSTIPGTVKFYTLNPLTSLQGLEDRVKITARSGTGGDFATCTGFVAGSTLFTAQSLAAISTAYTDYASAVGSWVTTGGATAEDQTYQFTWTFDTTGMTQAELDLLQGSRTGIDFEWEIKSN